MSFNAQSPSSSPRLPSPPPIAEDQLGPKSPLLAATGDQQMLSSEDAGSRRRIRPGAKSEEIDRAPQLPDVEKLNAASEPRDWLEAKHRSLTHPDPDTTTAINREKALQLVVPPKDVDKTVWLYQLCLFITNHTNSVLTGLFRDDPPCSSVTCPEMRASEWQYLCAVHEPPKPCCAIDYCCHTLDWAANILSSTKIFPSRLGQGVDQNSQHQQVRHLTNIFRRVYRIFAHAWFQHREVFWQVEGRTGLYMLLKTICDHYGLIPDDSYTIPPEAEGEDAPPAAAAAPPEILRRAKSASGGQEAESSLAENAADHTLSTAGTTKRHRHSPSAGGSGVSTVIEETEEEDLPARPATGAAKEAPRPAEDEEKEASSEVTGETQVSSIEPSPSSTEESQQDKVEEAKEDTGAEEGQAEAAPTEEVHQAEEVPGAQGEVGVAETAEAHEASKAESKTEADAEAKADENKDGDAATAPEKEETAGTVDGTADDDDAGAGPTGEGASGEKKSGS